MRSVAILLPMVLLGLSVAGGGDTLAEGAPGRAASSSLQRNGTACTRKETRQTFSAFLNAFNEGGLSKLDSLFAVQPAFQWYSSSRPGTRLKASARDRDTLVSYFRSRHKVGDRMRILTFDFNGTWGGDGSFGIELKRSAEDYAGGTWFSLTGKGACVSGDSAERLTVLSLGAPQKVPVRSR